MKKYKILIIGVFFLVIMSLALYLRSVKVLEINKNREDISKLLEKNDNTDKLAYVDIYVTPYMIAEYPNDSNAFYVVYNNNYYSVLYMNKKEAGKITKDMVENGYRINGITKSKPDGIEKYGLKFLETLFSTHDENDGHDHHLDDNSYEEYLGNIYLDATLSKYQETKIYNIIIYVSGIISGLCLLKFIYKYNLLNL